MTTTILELKSIGRTYKGTHSSAGLEVLRDVSLTIKAGEMAGLVGPSGSGKSTLLHTAGLLEAPEAGDVLIDGESCGGLNDRGRTRIRAEKLGFIYQFHHLLAEFNAVDNVAMPLLVAGWRKKDARKEAERILDRMGLSHRLSHQPATLSGGEQQRVAIARALVNRPRLIIADEPTGNLDVETTAKVFTALIELARESDAAILIATHNLALTAHMDWVVTLEKGALKPWQGHGQGHGQGQGQGLG